MKKGRISIVACIFIASTILCSVSYGQVRVNWEEFPALVKTITYDVPEGKALLVFEGREDYRFVSDNENIDRPVKDGLLYKLLVSIEPSSGGINISSPGVESYPLNYGRPYEESLPALNNKEIRYFKLSIIKLLFCDDKTVELSKTNADIPSEGDDALIIIFPNPQTLDLQFDGNITSQKHENDRYRIYIQTGNQKLTVKSKNYTDKTIDLDSLKKEVRFFRVQAPITNDDNITEDPNVKVGNYVIETTPLGAVIQMVGNPPFNERNFKTPYTIEGFKAGSEIITLALDRYEPIKDTILISSSKGKKSKYKLIPKFAFLNCNIEPSIPTSKVLFDGKELIGITQGKDYECPKGTHNIEYSAPHYYPQTKQVSLAAGESIEMNVKLRPKMGSLTILSGINATDAEVLINGKKVGNIPISNFALQEGNYNVTFNKSGYISENPTYTLEILENKLSKIEDLKMISTKKVTITTNPDGATVFIDNKLIGKSTVSTKLSLGEHSIRLEKDNYKKQNSIIKVSSDAFEISEFSYILSPEDYKLILRGNPNVINYSVAGHSSGETPNEIYLPYGNHSVEFTKKNYFSKTKNINLTKNNLQKKVKLFPNSKFYYLGFNYGMSMWNVSLNMVQHSIFWGAGVGMNNNQYDFNYPISQQNANVDDLASYNPVGKISMKDSLGLNGFVKIGLIIPKPFPLILSIGWAGIAGKQFQNVYQAKKDYASYDGSIITKGDYFIGPTIYSKFYNAITFGITIPITRYFFVNADYYTNSETGEGFMFGGGFILDAN